MAGPGGGWGALKALAESLKAQQIAMHGAQAQHWSRWNRKPDPKVVKATSDDSSHPSVDNSIAGFCASHGFE